MNPAPPAGSPRRALSATEKKKRPPPPPLPPRPLVRFGINNDQWEARYLGLNVLFASNTKKSKCDEFSGIFPKARKEHAIGRLNDLDVCKSDHVSIDYVPETQCPSGEKWIIRDKNDYVKRQICWDDLKGLQTVNPKKYQQLKAAQGATEDREYKKREKLRLSR